MGAREDIITALQRLDKPASIREISEKIHALTGRKYKDIGTACADLTKGGNQSSHYSESQKCLIRVNRGVYRLASQSLPSKETKTELVQTKVDVLDQAIHKSIVTRHLRQIKQNHSIVCSVLLDGFFELYSTGSNLLQLIGPKKTTNGHDKREYLMENVASSILNQNLPDVQVWIGNRFSNVFPGTRSFPGRSIPDLVVKYGHGYAVCEFKAARITDPRFDDVLEKDSSLAKYLVTQGCDYRRVTEVEQDLIKLLAYREASKKIFSGIFIMIDGYGAMNEGRSWSRVLNNKKLSSQILKTSIVKKTMEQVYRTLSVKRIECGNLAANMISYEIS